MKQTSGRLENLLRALDVARIGYFSSNLTKGVYEPCPELAAIYGLPADRVPSRDEVIAATHPDDRGRLITLLDEVKQNPRNYEIEYRVLRRDCAEHFVRVVAHVWRENNGDVCAFGTVQDVTSVRRAEVDAKTSHARLQDFGHGASDWFWETDEYHRFSYLSAGIEGLTGISIGHFIGKTRLEVVSDPYTPDGCQAHLADLDARRPFQDFRYWIRAPHLGRDILINVSGRPIFDNGRFCGYRGIGTNITAQIDHERAMRQLATRDGLTGLLNRTAFDNALTQILQAENATDDGAPEQAKPARGQRALLLLDLLRFHSVNESFGRSAGDRLLNIVGQRLRNALSKQDLIARLSGDEFAIILTGAHAHDDIEKVGKRLIGIVTRPIKLENSTVQVEAGIGVLKEISGDLDTVMARANLALNAAKKTNRDLVFFDEPMRAKANRRFTLEKDLSLALDHGEFSLRFQPQVSIVSGKLTGVEALLRWRAGTPHEIYPDEFIPIAEEAGMMGDIGRWVLREALKQGEAWRHAGLPVMTIGVNVSPTQFIYDELASDVIAAVDQSFIDRDRVELEITETVLMRDEAKAAVVLRDLRAAGIAVALDDFGTGFSSLSHLHAYPVDRLKIDRSFVAKICDEKSAQAIVKGIVQLADSLAIDVIAEGVETQGHAEILEQLGCEVAQGYYYAKPLTAEAIVDWYADQQSTPVKSMARTSKNTFAIQPAG